ncbi:hypothetical protein RBA18_22765, partial [Mycobacteroides abscessus subsp. massiliense]
RQYPLYSLGLVTHLQPLPIVKVYDRRNRRTYRWYIDFATTCGTVQSERIDITDDDVKAGYNRTEHLRQHTKTDEGHSLFDRCYGWREDAESLNNTLERRWARRRPRSARRS